jgi:hypothetical protein
LLFSVYNLGTVLAIAIILGLAYGIRSYLKKNPNFKLFKLKWNIFWTDIITSVIFGVGTYLLLKYVYGIRLTWKGTLLLFVILMVMFYAFSAVFSTYLEHKKKKKNHLKNVILIILFNPVFVMIYLGLFAMIIYNTYYIPCGVTIVDIDKNMYTANTANLGIIPGEKIVSIDGIEIGSLYNIKEHINSLESTKQIVVETDENIYYVRTYMKDKNRYMGLILKQEYCAKEY